MSSLVVLVITTCHVLVEQSLCYWGETRTVAVFVCAPLSFLPAHLSSRSCQLFQTAGPLKKVISENKCLSIGDESTLF